MGWIGHFTPSPDTTKCFVELQDLLFATELSTKEEF
jgi:hypothetical protein